MLLLRRRLPAAPFSVALSLMSSGCGGGAALMHPAHTLPAGEVTFGAGASQTFVLGNANREVDQAIETINEDPGTPTTPGTTRTLEERNADVLEGAIAYSLMTPGLAPWVGGRAGLGYDIEAGLTYTGRAVRLDARHAFESDRTALSLGLGVNSRLLHPEQSPGTIGEVPLVNDGGLAGVGFDVPIIAGWRSSANLVQVYGGVRGGYEALFGTYLVTSVSQDSTDGEAEVRARRGFVGGLFGLIVGVAPIWVGFELDGTYHHGRGKVNEVVEHTAPENWPRDELWVPAPVSGFDQTETGTLSAFGLTPTGVIIGQFN
jgi:hypothetical protein